jgi:hypothetical protein
MRDHKHILVSITYKGVLHWRLVAATREGRHWQISVAAYTRFLNDIGQASTGGRISVE